MAPNPDAGTNIMRAGLQATFNNQRVSKVSRRSAARAAADPTQAKRAQHAGFVAAAAAAQAPPCTTQHSTNPRRQTRERCPRCLLSSAAWLWHPPRLLGAEMMATHFLLFLSHWRVATALVAASSKSLAEMMATSLSERMRFPSSTLVPSSRTTRGTLTPTCSAGRTRQLLEQRGAGWGSWEGG